MITTPQVLVIYEPGMFGSMLESILSGYKSDFQGSSNYDVHEGKKGRILKDFHDDPDYFRISNMSDKELREYFSYLDTLNMEYQTHHLNSYRFCQIDFEKYFKKVLRVIIKAKEEDIEAFGLRHIRIKQDFNATSPNGEYSYMKYIKNTDKVPKWFLEKATIKEYVKFTKEHIKILESCTLPDNTLYIDPLELFDENKMKSLLDNVSNWLGNKNFELPKKQLEDLYDRNKEFFDKSPK